MPTEAQPVQDSSWRPAPGNIVQARGDNPEGHIDEPGPDGVCWRMGDRFVVVQFKGEVGVACHAGSQWHGVEDEDWPLDFAPAVDLAEGDEGHPPAAGMQYGEPLPHYAHGEASWPAVWRLPEQDDDDADLFDKVCHLADDVLLREAVHIYDNCLRLPAAISGVAAGMLSAHARLMVGHGIKEGADLDAMADAMRTAWRAMAEQALTVHREGWDALPRSEVPTPEES